MNHKKSLDFRRFEKERRERHLRFKKIFPVRWAASVYEAALRIHRKYATLMSHLEKIINSPNKVWKKAIKEKAEAIRDDLDDENFLILLHLQIDVLSHMALQSLYYQKSAATVIGEYRKQRLFTEKLKHLKTGKSEYLSKFLNEVKCTNDEDELQKYLDPNDDTVTDIASCGTIENYENSNYKAYKGHKLYLYDSQFERLSTYLERYVDKLVQNHEKYMFQKEELMEEFDEMNHRNWVQVSQNDGQPIINLGKYFKIKEYQRLGQSWLQLKEALLNSNFFCTHKSDNPRTFWSLVLQNQEFVIPNNLKRLIQTVLVIATNSADAERLFRDATN